MVNAFETRPLVKEDALTWEYDANTSTIYLHGAGPMRDYYSDYPEWYEYRDTAVNLVADEGITSIGAYAFADFPALRTVTLPDSIEIIAESAFDYCWDLWTVTIPKNLEYIGERAFYNAIIHEPKNLAFPEGLKYIGYNAFHAALIESEVTIPASCVYLGAEPFTNSVLRSITVAQDNPYYCAIDNVLFTKDMKNLIQYTTYKTDTEYRIPDGVETLRALSFNVTYDLQTVYIPASVTRIEEGAFFYDYALTDIFVDEANTAYKSVNGVLYTKDGTELLAYPTTKEVDGYVVPEGTEHIGGNMFVNRRDLTSITLPSTLKSIADGAFGSTALTSVTLPAGLEVIEDYAFYYSEDITDVYFGGTEEQFHALLDETIGNDPLLMATVHFGS